MKYLYILLIIAIIVVLIKLFIELTKLMKKAAGLNDNINKLNDDINNSNQKVEEIKSTEKSWKFFFSIYIILSVLKEVFKDYKRSSLLTRNLPKSFAKTCAKNVGKIKKISI